MSLEGQLIVGQVLSSFGLGGQERVALELSRELARRGHRTFAVSLADDPDAPVAVAFRDNGIDTFRVAKRPGFDSSLYGRLTRLFLREQPTVVHTHNPLPLIYAAVPARVSGASAVHTKHGANPGTATSRWLRRRAAAATSAFVAVSEQTALQALRQGDCAARRLHIIANGVDVDRFAPDPAARAAVRAELGIPEQACLVGSVGRLDPAKDYELLLRACAPLLGERVHLAIAGDGPCAPRLRAAVAASGRAPYVHLLGRRLDVPRVLAAFDLFALSSRTEGLPLVVPEAMACELPVVSTAVGGLGEVVVHEETGFLVQPGGEEELRARIRQLVGDRRLARDFGRRGRGRAAASFSVQRMADDYVALYRHVGGRRGEWRPGLEL